MCIRDSPSPTECFGPFLARPRKQTPARGEAPGGERHRGWPRTVQDSAGHAPSPPAGGPPERRP
eukprot:12961546-Alexandrium_andersonii.AAC.1